MKYPCLVEKRLCKTDIHIEIEQEGLNKYGEPLETIVLDKKCNYQDKGNTVLTAEKKLIQLSGMAYFTGDICPELPLITGGTIKVHGVTRDIYQGTKARNPDGTVNYTLLELM